MLYPINIKKYKTLFIFILIANIVLITVPFVLVKMGYVFFPAYKGSKLVSYSLIGLLITGTLLLQVKYQRKKLIQIAWMPFFDARIKLYNKLFTIRMYWHLVSCIVTAIIIIVTLDTYFFYYGILDVVMAFMYYPRLALFQRELREENIVLV
ncbi:hypothetical protein ACFS6H_03045 [Terrimonas rubra]|uniref:Uncharacterized protein n=1 Tax=Terrimonas rubra TaxID=1035890 RepID=A0ABW6A1F3_9BACT